jgi:hypothetical protein
MTLRSRAFALLLAWVALTVQTKSAQLPAQALNQLAKPPVATVVPMPNPAVVNSPVDLQVTITPAVNGPLEYEVYVNGARLTQCPTNSPMCQWTASEPGDYAFHAIVHGPAALGRRGRGSPALTITGPRSILTVQAPPAPTPTPTPTVPDKIPDNVAPLPEVTIEPAPLPAPAPAPPIALQLRALPDDVRVDESITFQVSTTDGRPITAYSFDPGDGSGPRTLTSDTFVASYSRAGRYVAAVSPPAGQAGASATALIVVNPVFPWIWIYIAVGIVGVAAVVWVFKRPTSTPATSPPPAQHTPPVMPAATFHPHPVDTPRFEPSKGNGIALEVHYVPNIASLSYAPRVRINEEQS